MPPIDNSSTLRESQVYDLVVGQLILRLRERCRLSQGAVADAVGLSQATLSRIERGSAQPDPFVLRQIAEHFGITPSMLTAYVETAYERTKVAAQNTLRLPAEALWLELALTAAGTVGLMNLVGFAVASVIHEADPCCGRRPRARQASSRIRRS